MSAGEQQQQQETGADDMAAHGPNIIERYGKQIAFGAVALVTLFAVFSWVTNTGRAGSEESWSKFAEAQNASDFADVATDYAGTEVAVWARLVEGEMLLREGVQLQFSDRAAADRQIEKAGEALDSVLDNADLPVAARERALLGKARLLEATSDGKDGNIDKAIAAYEEVKGIPNSIYKDLVESRIEKLTQVDTTAFYAWFSEQTPKPEDRATPRDGMMPSGHGELPITLPPIPEELRPADWSDLTVSDDLPFEVPADTKEGSATEPADGDAAPADGDSPADGDAAAKPSENSDTPAADKSSDADAPAADKSSTDGKTPAKDDAAPSESSTPE